MIFSSSFLVKVRYFQITRFGGFFVDTSRISDNIADNIQQGFAHMPKFSQASFSNLSTCHQDLQALFYEVIKHYDCTVLQGYRNQEDQEKAFEAGRTTLHWPHGKHNYNPSLAVDVTPYPINLSDDKRALWFGGYVLGIAQRLKDEGKMTHAIRWGGAWNGLGQLNNNHVLNDLVHFELLI